MGLDPWDKLDKQIRCCEEIGLAPTFWWRDDDASAPTPALTRMIELARSFDIPLSLAVIPARTGAALRNELNSKENITVLQHGYAHLNHAAAGQKKCEFPLNPPSENMRNDLMRGQHLLAGFTHSAPVFVPPWNRMDEQLMPLLADLGFRGISQFGAAPTQTGHRGLRRLNTHVDVIAWKTTRGFVGLERAIGAICDHLAARCLLAKHSHDQTAMTGSEEATGLLTHHLVHDEETWKFLSGLFDFSRNYSTIKWLPVGRAMLNGEKGSIPADRTANPDRKT